MAASYDSLCEPVSDNTGHVARPIDNVVKNRSHIDNVVITYGQTFL